MILKLKMENFSKVNQMKFKSAPHHFPLYFINFEENMLSSLMKILEWLEVSGLKMFQMEFKSFSNPFSFLWWKKSYYLHSSVCFEFKFWIPWNQKKEMKVSESHFIPSHSTFKKFQISLNFTQENHTSNHTTIR